MSEYGAFSDDFYINMHLNTQMDLPHSRDSVLHYFEQIQKRYPSLIHFSSREDGEFVLQEEKSNSIYRWASIEKRRLSSGSVNPGDIDSALEMHRLILEHAPYALSLGRLDCESLSVIFAFDFTFRGNHNEILAEALGVPKALEPFLQSAATRPLSYEPALHFSLDEDCQRQCRISFESRSTDYQIRTGDFSEDQISVYLAMRRYDSLLPGENYTEEFDRLVTIGRDLADTHLIPNVLRPLQETISSRS